ncbi:hypothetical protein CT0861_06263 [Colletotrichum tofieldiae]|uniref:Uncharacterized protein n=1 Tax=Colletotrichum tofieldiae TaxID=708197 RepID=A0A166MKD2_9PEZI|nr:hypothetical protein CT0861_06263 [Colletotrichum tofieldiae]
MLLSALVFLTGSLGVKALTPTPPSLEYLFFLNATLDSAINTGAGPSGTRLAIGITGGSLSGPKGNGTVLPVGGDFGAFDALGTFNVDSQLVLKMDDGSYLYTHSVGPVISGPTAVDRVKFETGSEKYGWLNEIFAIAVTDFPGSWVALDVWQVHPST